MTPGAWACNLALYGIGVGIMPMGVVLTINAHLGAGGYDALNFALAERLRINTSLGIYATAVLVVILTAFIRKGYPLSLIHIFCEYGIMHDIGRYDQKVIVLQMINLISYNIIHMAAYKVQQFIKFMIMGFYCRVSNIPVVVQLKIIGVHIMLQHFFTVG